MADADVIFTKAINVNPVPFAIFKVKLVVP